MKKKEKSLLTKEMKAAVALISAAVELASNGLLVGLSAWVNYILLGIDDVGIVISTFNQFTSAGVAAKRLRKKGYNTAYEVTMSNKATKKDKRLAQLIIDLWRTVFGVVRGVDGTIYITALDYSVKVVDHAGFEYVKVTLEMVKACFERASRIDGELPLVDIEQFCLDSEAIKRFYGEYTIDATKKPEDFLRDKPYFSYMKNVSQRSRRDYSVSIDRKAHTVIQEGTSIEPEVDENGKEKPFCVPMTVKGDKNKVIDRDDNRGIQYRMDMVDIYQEVRAEAANYLVELAELCMDVPVQKLPKEELDEIKATKDKYSKTVGPAVELMKQEWQSMSTAIKAIRKEVEKKFGKKSYAAEQHVKAQKQHNNVCYSAITNQLRIIFENANIMDPVVRIRILLFTVMGHLQKVKWDELSDFAHSALPEEWFIYTMTMMKDDAWTPQETMDKVSFVIELTDEQLMAINGKKVRFEDGMLAGKNGEIIAVADGVDLNGEFVLRVADDGVYACHDIVSLVNVPKADRDMVIFATASDSQTVANVDHILETMMDKEVRLAPFCKDAIVVDGKAIGKFRCSLNGKNSKAISDMYGGANGVRGYVTEVVRGQYEEESGKIKKVAVVVLRNSTAPMLDEEVDGIGHLPELEVKEVKKPKLDRRAIGLKMNGATGNLF